MLSSTPLLALALGLALVIIGMVTADPFRMGFFGFFARQQISDAFWLFLIGCLLVTVGACSLLDGTTAAA